MKHRDIKKDEINKITEECGTFREKAFFTIMRQSGLTPRTIKQLKIMHLPKILDPYTPIPCKINIPQEKFPTFIGQEAINYLKHYLGTRPDKLTLESLLFCTHKKPNTQVNTKNISRSFQRTAQKLKKHKKITYEVRSRKPSELRLYSLIKFYRKNAKSYLTELNNNYTPKDDDFYRKLYEEKAMPFLEIESSTTIDIHHLNKEIEKRDNQIKELQERLTHLEVKISNVEKLEQALKISIAKITGKQPEEYRIEWTNETTKKINNENNLRQQKQ